jgi:hypothetical protein
MAAVAVTIERPCGQDRCMGRRQGSISSAAGSAAAMASGLPVRMKTSTAASRKRAERGGFDNGAFLEYVDQAR